MNTNYAETIYVDSTYIGQLLLKVSKNNHLIHNLKVLG